MVYRKRQNPIKTGKIRCAVQNCGKLGYAFFRGKSFCEEHYKELKEFLGRFKI
jgi:hypothetical protein